MSFFPWPRQSACSWYSVYATGYFSMKVGEKTIPLLIGIKVAHLGLQTVGESLSWRFQTTSSISLITVKRESWLDTNTNMMVVAGTGQFLSCYTNLVSHPAIVQRWANTINYTGFSRNPSQFSQRWVKKFQYDLLLELFWTYLSTNLQIVEMLFIATKATDTK